MAKFKCKVCGAEQDAETAPMHCNQPMEAAEAAPSEAPSEAPAETPSEAPADAPAEQPAQ